MSEPMMPNPAGGPVVQRLWNPAGSAIAGLMDLLLAGLAAYTAFRVGAGHTNSG